jgi:hypothetical protein
MLPRLRQVRALKADSCDTSWLAMGQQEPALSAVAEKDSLRRLQVGATGRGARGGRQGGGRHQCLLLLQRQVLLMLLPLDRAQPLCQYTSVSCGDTRRTEQCISHCIGHFLRALLARFTSVPIVPVTTFYPHNILCQLWCHLAHKAPDAFHRHLPALLLICNPTGQSC